MNCFNDWDHYFLSLCYFVASKSKDLRTQVGAVIVQQDNDSYVTGYNGFPRGLQEIEQRRVKPFKFIYTEHAERNAIYNCARKGISTKGSKVFITCLPCPDCARGIIQAGIVEVVYHHFHPQNHEEAIIDIHEQVKSMFDECGIKLRQYVGDIKTNCEILYNGVIFNPNDFHK